MYPRLLYLFLAAVPASLSPCRGLAASPPWQEIPPIRWQGLLKAEVPALKRRAAVAVALPASDAQPLTAATIEAQPAGVYEFRLTLRPSHVADAIAFNAGVRVKLGDLVVAEFAGQFFSRAHQPEARTLRLLQPKAGPMALTLEAFADPQITEKARVAADLRKGGPKMTEPAAVGESADLDLQLETALTPDKAVYYVVDKIECRPGSRSGQVVKVEIDRIRYRPGETLKGRAVVADVGGRGGRGTLELQLEHLAGQRAKVKSIPVTLGNQPLTVDFELPLPQQELGYALVAEFVSADGADRSEAAEYFTIAGSFQRVAIFGGGLATRDAVQDDDTIRRGLTEARAGYYNATEYFAWAEDDLVEMSPEADFWSSGQTNYRMHKQTLQRQIRLAHEQGFAVSTYGKYLMSGFPGWETAYDYPYDHRGQYYYPIGMYLGVSASTLDRRRHRDTPSYIRHTEVKGNAFDTWWNYFLPINCDATPHMVRIAAEECVRSIEVFGWDAIRWDGHPSVYSQGGRAGIYSAGGARQTQTLVRYFKDIVAQRHPDFRHGYNYLGIQREKNHAWAVEDFELDELCRGGGLLMNESIGNASGGYTFAQIARNLQVDGDLCRERGGYYLGISYAKSPRDVLIESALWAAAGCRPYGMMSYEVRRYCTRYAHYTFDENLRRLTQPAKVLAPRTETRLWWQPFVYETPTVEGHRQLVVNLLNLPLDDKRPGRDSDDPPVWTMPPGTDPVEFELALPAGLTPTGVTRIDPWTLAAESVPLAGNRFTVAPVGIWSVLVIDLECAPAAPALASLYGPPVTFGVPRPNVEEAKRRPAVVLDPAADLATAEQQFAVLQPEWASKRRAEEAALAALSGKELEAALLARRQSPEVLMKEWWKGASLPADLDLKGKVPDFGDLTPRRDGRMDIHYGRGTMDYRLRMACAFARLDRFRVHDAPLWGGGVGYNLAYRVDWPRFPGFDLLLFTGIPHSAIGVENSYALVAYVKAGGAVFFTGGEYAFGKGGYMHTVLERELLPLQCAGMQDTAYADPPLPVEPGADFADLRVTVDFAAKPVFWVRNQVVLKPGAKVFLQSRGRPLLVGWQLGKGRVACLLVDHRGKSEANRTAFFDWQDWPKLVAAVIAWLAPDASGQSAPPAPPDVRQSLQRLAQTADDKVLDDLEQPATGDGLPTGPVTAPAKQLEGAALQERCALIDRALAGADDPLLAAALAQQLATVGSLPLNVRLRILALLQRVRPAVAAELGRAALRTGDSTLHGSGYALLALAGVPEFAAALAAPPTVAVETADMARERTRDLAMAVLLYPKQDLVAEGRRRVEAWNRQEETTRAAFAKVAAPDTDLVATSGPYLDAEAVLARIAWLAYLARHTPADVGTSFIREWVMIGEYQDYAERTIQGLYKDKSMSDAARPMRIEGWRSLSARLASLRDLTRPDVEKLLATRPADVAAALTAVRFAPQIRDAVNLLGDRPAKETGIVLSALEKAVNADLAAFAATRGSAAAGGAGSDR